MTMNSLPYPYTQDKADDTEEDKEKRKADLGAFNARMKLIKLEQSFKNNDKFPLS